MGLGDASRKAARKRELQAGGKSDDEVKETLGKEFPETPAPVATPAAPAQGKVQGGTLTQRAAERRRTAADRAAENASTRAAVSVVSGPDPYVGLSIGERVKADALVKAEGISKEKAARRVRPLAGTQATGLKP